MRNKLLLICLLMPLIMCSESPVESNSDEEITASFFLEQTSPENTIHNLFTAIGFTDTTISLQNAINAYQNCFVHDDSTVEYYFIYSQQYSGASDTLNLFKDTLLMSKNFSYAADSTFNMDFYRYQIQDDSVNMAFDSTTSYPFSVYSCNVYTRIAYDVFNSTHFPYMIEGSIVLYLKICDDGEYRIFRWYDTSDEVLSKKSTTMGNSSWWHFKTFFMN